MDSLPIKSSFQIRLGRTTCHTLARRPINQVGILCVRVRADPGLQQVLGDAEPAGGAKSHRLPFRKNVRRIRGCSSYGQF